MNELTHEMLKSILKYDQTTGVFTWLGVGHSRPKAGTRAGSLKPDGYRKIRAFGVLHLAHRLAWFYVHETHPQGQIDHINGMRDDNRIANLRDVSAHTNQQNRRSANKNNKTGLLGVSHSKNKFKAQIQIGDKMKNIGVFDCAHEAHAAYLNAKRATHFGCTI